jgi:hypothetical protein
VNARCLASLVAILHLLLTSRIPAVAAGAADTRGLRCVSRAPFSVPQGTTVIPLPGGDFETGGKAPQGWSLGGGKILFGSDAPQGKS